MTFSTIGDLAQAFALRHRNTEVKTDIQRINQELATGQAADLAKHLGGSYAQLSDIERSIRLLDSYSVNTTSARQLTDMMQTRLGHISTITTDFAGDLFAAATANSQATHSALVEEAKLQFSTIVGTLNSQTAGRSLFAGDETRSQALSDPDVILADLSAAVAGVTNRADLEARVETWFANALGFEAAAYTGGDDPLSPFQLSETARISVDVRANSAEVKGVLAGFAKMIASEALTMTPADLNTLRTNAATDLVGANEQLIGLQAKVGLAQEQIDKWSVRTEASRTALDYAKGALLAVDPYERATQLEAAQFQLESLYTVTARLSRLSLVNYLS